MVSFVCLFLFHTEQSLEFQSGRWSKQLQLGQKKAIASNIFDSLTKNFWKQYQITILNCRLGTANSISTSVISQVLQVQYKTRPRV